MHLLFALVFAPSAQAQGTLIDFDTLTPGCNFSGEVPLSTEFLADGVEFVGPSANDGGAVLDECGNFSISGHSSPNFLAFNTGTTMSNGGVARTPETLLFDPPASYVSLLAGHGSSGTVTLTAYGATGNQLDQDSIGASSTLTVMEVSGSGITEVVLEATGSIVVVDDLYFENIDCQPTDPDTDGDGVCDMLDACPYGDDNVDTDTDGVPDDCDNCPSDVNPGQYDGDLDGLGTQCDCDDDDEQVFPGANELCDGIDNDCNGAVDDNPVDGLDFFRDDDGDGHGDPNDSVHECDPPDGFNFKDTDCDDTNADVHPDAAEVCDGIDNNCNGAIDEISGCEETGTIGDPKLGCGCRTADPAAGWWLSLAALLVARKRRS